MKRREFVCAAMGSAATLAVGSLAHGEEPVRRYARSLLVDEHGGPIRAWALQRDTNYVFQYPYAATPCFLLRLSKAIVFDASADAAPDPAWPGGVGPERTLVAFSAICAHKLAYPTRDVSFIRYQRDPSKTSNGHVIHCCADHSVYDPTRAARVMAGPAPQPLAAILLEHDAQRDQLYATGTIGPEQFARFFAQYEMRLTLEYGSTRKARAAVADNTVVRELTSYCRTTIQC
ncbi:MAG TPA: (2Fe-2S)-binding protein [Casimicrobiaceae bacterium]|nr:(2Fe-2S)-binding protein [Casimicrobiaceae bacterium]